MEEYYQNEEWYHLWPLMFLIMIVPLIVHLKVVPLTGPAYEFWNGQKENLDFFSYYKSIWIIVSTIFALLMVGVKSYQLDFKEGIRKSYYYIPMGVYSILVIISSFLSEYPQIAKSGFNDRYEGMYIIICYMTILFVTINLVKKEKHIKIMLGALFIGAMILGTIGLFQYIGYDIWKSDFGRSIMLPSRYLPMADKLKFLFGKHTIYATLYHTDYVGSYMAMLFPLAFTIFMLCKNKVIKGFMGFFTLLMALNWFGCNSRAGMVGGVIAILILFVMINKYIIKHWKYFLGGILVLLVIFILLNTTSKGYLGSQISRIINDAGNITQKQNVDKDIAEKSIPLKDVKILGNSAEVITQSETLKFDINYGKISFKDETNTEIPSAYEKSTGKMTFYSDKFKDYQVSVGMMGDKTILSVIKGQIKLKFNIDKDIVTLIDNKGKPIDLAPVEKWGFEGKEKLGSSRGYIWSRSIPLLKNTRITGYGPDTFAIYFPQNDFKGKMYAYDGDMWQIVDKPHNLYLQIALSTGLISLVAILALFIMYFVNSVKLYFGNDFDSFTAIAGVGIFVAVCGYLGAAFFNDSLVSVAPVFWTLLGMGIATNYVLIKSKAVNN